MLKKSQNGGGVWKHSPRIAWRKVADEAVILQVETAVYYSLRGPGLAAWELIGKGKKTEEIGKILSESYDAPPARIGKDLSALFASLKKEGLIERA